MLISESNYMVLASDCYYVKPVGARGDSGASPAASVGSKIQDIPMEIYLKRKT